MTAKEMLEQFSVNGACETELSGDEYIFTRQDLAELIDQICKEQKELCIQEISRKVLIDSQDTKNLIKLVIKNSSHLKIFTEDDLLTTSQMIQKYLENEKLKK